FGYQNYGGSVEGYLVLPMNTTFHTECTQEPLDLNPYIHWLKDWTGDSSNVFYIFLVDRGSCYFVNKVENTQALSAIATIVLDNLVESLFNMWSPENWDDDIVIPSVLLGFLFFKKKERF
ncbi:hypothetical protein RFI_01892, partial [Reticulomyxa filosa]